MFSQASVILSTGGGGCTPPRQTPHPHPTGMHSCYCNVGRKGRVLFVLPVEDPGHDGRTTGRGYERSTPGRIQKHVS